MQRQTIFIRIGWGVIFYLVLLALYASLRLYLIPPPLLQKLDLILYGSEWVTTHHIQYEQNSGWRLFHVLPGSVLLVLGLLQFSEKIRDKWPKIHRSVGKIYVGLGLLVSATGVFLGIIIPFAGSLETIINTLVSAAVFVMLMKGYIHIRHRNIKAHRAWMIRAFALILGVATMRVYYFIFLFFTSIPASKFFNTADILGFLTNIIVAEIYIRCFSPPLRYT